MISATTRHDPRAFKFQPRHLVQVARQFGQTGLLLEPAEGIDRDDARFRAAQLQHVVANAAREALLSRGYSLRSYVGELEEVPGMTYERLVRIQRGETLMQLADLMAWASRFETVRDLLAAAQTWPEARPRRETEEK